jgi:glutamate--cysteine ligase
VNPTYSSYERRLSGLVRTGLGDSLKGNLVGLEKESLRVSLNGTIADTPHPTAFGSALTHPYITTDFSEALLELVTPPSERREEALRFLRDLHVFVHRHLDDELLWATSMPCVLEGARSIPIAEYGSSNAAQMKTVYRRGLGNRYGRVMQVIAGVHYNFSFADAFWPPYQELEQDRKQLRHFRSESYMGLTRNLQRYGWLIPYLFGASPAVCKSFLQGRSTDLEELDRVTYFYPYGTSLRLGDIGYQNRQTEGTGMKAVYDSLDAYIRSLTWAIETPCPDYEKIGIKVGDRYEQLNANVLQIENEYYSTVRPKQIPGWLEKPTRALRRRGIRYIEVRSLDVNAFHPVGIAEEQLRFMEVFMLFCLLAESPRIDGRERRAIDRNQLAAAHRGRDPALELERDGGGIRLKAWGSELIDAMGPAAELLDGHGGGPSALSLGQQQEKVRDAELTPSARMLAEMRSRGESFYQFARAVSEEHRDYFRRLELSAAAEAELERLALESRQRQREIEAMDNLSFDEFLARYFAQREIVTQEPVMDARRH